MSRTAGEVLVWGGEWLPSGCGSENLEARVSLREERRERAGARKERGRRTREQAEEFRRLLAEGVVGSQAELARRFGISRARVSQVLASGRRSSVADAS